jgi:hypothetical protein
MLLLARKSATVRPSRYIFYYQKLTVAAKEAIVCQKISVCVLAHTALESPIFNL